MGHFVINFLYTGILAEGGVTYYGDEVDLEDLEDYYNVTGTNEIYKVQRDKTGVTTEIEGTLNYRSDEFTETVECIGRVENNDESCKHDDTDVVGLFKELETEGVDIFVNLKVNVAGLTEDEK